MIFILHLNINFLVNNFYDGIEKLSKKVNYQFIHANVNGLKKVENIFIENKLKKYYEKSIFLLPLDKISMDIKENNWIKNVKLNTNYKDTLFIEIEEFEPIAIYNFNNKSFYFDKHGKIIEEVNTQYNIKENLIVFKGQLSNLKANNIINIINNLNFRNKFKIKYINYIEKRRWDILLENNTKLLLSETSPKKSLQNFMIIKKKLSKKDLNNIKTLDLRDTSKTIITYIDD